MNGGDTRLEALGKHRKSSVTPIFLHQLFLDKVHPEVFICIDDYVFAALNLYMVATST